MYEAAKTARKMGNTDYRSEAFSILALRLAEADKPRTALKVLREISDETWRAKGIAQLARWLPPSLFKEALSLAQEIENECWRAKALTGLATRLPEKEKNDILHQALELTRNITNTQYRAEALAALVPYLSSSGRPTPAHRMQQQFDKEARVKSQRKLAVGTGRVSKPKASNQSSGKNSRVASSHSYKTVYPSQETPNIINLLHFLSRSSRSDFLSDIQVMATAISELGGEEAISEILHAVQDVGRWWP